MIKMKKILKEQPEMNSMEDTIRTAFQLDDDDRINVEEVGGATEYEISGMPPKALDDLLKALQELKKTGKQISIPIIDSSNSYIIIRVK